MVVLEDHNLTVDVVHNASTHHHGHLHHDPSAEKGREDELLYSEDTTSTIPYQNPQNHDLHRRHQSNNDPGSVEVIDAEKGAISSPPVEEEGPQSQKFSGFYARYRIFFHLFLWLFFTG